MAFSRQEEQFLNLDEFDSATIASPSLPSSQVPPSQILIESQDSIQGGVNFADLFRQYLAPEVAKLSTSLPSTSASIAFPPPASEEHPFALNSTADAPSFSPTDSFSPSAFFPNLPGSPIGAFSPSSGSDNNHSPVSFGELDFETGAEADALLNGAAPDWAAIDPSFLGASSSSSAGLVPSTSSFAPSLLPPLPQLPPVPAAAAPAPTPASVAPTPVSQQEPDIVIKQESTFSPIPEEDEDHDMGSDSDSDDSDAAPATKTSNGRRRASSSAPPSKRKAPTKAAKTSVAAYASETLHATSSKSNLPPVPEWNDKPDPEAYKKLNSKEKRQLRNKISARNFRHRRKEYITTLEEEISSRDTIIDQLRDEVGTMRVENKDLKSEVTLLKQKWDEMLAKMSAFTTPQPAAASNAVASVGLGVSPAKQVVGTAAEDWALDSPKMAPEALPTVATANVVAPVASGSGARRSGTRASSGIVKPNLQKDVAPTLKRSTGSWTTNMGMGGGFTSVHTTLMPEFNFLNAKSLASYGSGSFNPTINNLSAAQRSELPSVTAHLRSNLTSPPQQPQEPASTLPKGTFENFFESNPIWLRPDNIEEYRGQLYGKLANNLAGAAAAHKAAGASPSPNGSLPLPVGFRPAFFTPPRSPTSPPAVSLSGKEPRDPTSDLLAFQSPARATHLEQRQQADKATTALVAGLATQTLFSRLSGAFVDAFAGSTAEERKLGFSSAKVASVLDGSASLQVVPRGTGAPAPASADALAAEFGGLQLSSPSRCTFSDAQRWVNQK